MSAAALAQPPPRPASRIVEVCGGIEQHDEYTPFNLLWLTPRRTKTLIGLLDGPRLFDREALLYFARVGVAERNERGEYILTVPRGRELARYIRACKPPLSGEGY